VRTKTPLQAEKILTAAARLFAGQRFHEVRIEDVAVAAAVGKGTVYRYFRDKEELYEALLARAAEQVSSRLDNELARASGPQERLKAVVRTFLEYFDEQPHLFDLIQHIEVSHPLQPDSPWQRVRMETWDIMRAIFADARRTGAFAVRDPEVGLLMLLGGLRAVIRFGPRPRPADIVQRIVEDFLHGAARPVASRTSHRRGSPARMA
jgi:AcrR family transcriptional regulator